MHLKTALCLALFSVASTGLVQAQDHTSRQESTPAASQTSAIKSRLPGQERREKCWARWEEEKKELQEMAAPLRKKLAAGEKLDLTDQAMIYKADNQPSTFVTCG